MMSDDHDICRVCRSEGAADNPLFYPCLCTGSIKYVHQDCLVQWLRYSRNEFCELCKHKFSFTPVYSADMPSHLPIYDIVAGLVKSVTKALKYWFHYTLVAIAWLGVVPLTACRICRCLFTGSVSSLFTLPMDMLSTENIITDAMQGTFVVLCSLCVFISLVWLREQLVHGGIPAWLQDNQAEQADVQNLPRAGGVQNNNNIQQQQFMNQIPENAEFDEEFEMLEDTDEEVDAGELAGGEMDGGGVEAGGIDAGGEMDDGENEENEQNENGAEWNPMGNGWDRAAEDLTWERLLGLDGSLIFLEHVFWVVSLNTLFVLVFAFCPYHIGLWTVNGLRMNELAVKTQFTGVFTTMVGYLVVACSLVLLHTVLHKLTLNKARMIVGLCFVVVKVTILIVAEIGLFPLVCGWWLDICSLPMFNSTMKTRTESFQQSPGTVMFVHWLVGMVYVFYFASFILLLREIFRPGVLWFLRNVNDPDFNPIHEMIHINNYRHTRRFVLSLLIFGSTVMLMLWMPIKLIKIIFSSFLPYHVALSNDAPISELSLELLLLQVVLPSLLDQGHTRTWLKNLIISWTKVVAWILDLRSYLLGDESLEHREPADIIRGGNEPVRRAQVNDNNPPPAALGEAHQALLNIQGATGFMPYYRPKYFTVRIILLLILTCLSLFSASVISLVLPVWMGRQLMEIWMPGTKIHELYTAACGLYICWLTLRASVAIAQYYPQGWDNLLKKLKEWTLLTVNVVVLAFLLIGVVPLLIGVLFEHIVVVPLRVPLDQSPVFFPWQDWALGVLHTKIICGLTMMGPDWWLKQSLELVYNDGIMNLNIIEVIKKLCFPVILALSLTLSVPYLIANSIIPAIGVDGDLRNLVSRRIYPCGFALICAVAIILFNFKQFKRLYEHIKNDKYLVGRQLVNYDRKLRQTQTQAAVN